MNKLNINSPFFQFINTLAEFVLLNLLWIICCIPVVTIGASTTALYYVTMQTARNEHGYIVKNFFKSFKSNFKQATFIWVIFMVFGAILIFNLSFCITLKTTAGTVIFVIVGIFSFFYILSLLYVFPLLARFTNTTKQVLKNAPLIALLNMKYTIVILVITLLIPVILYLFPQFAVFLLIFGSAFFAYLNSFFYIKVFNRYENTEERKETLENNA